MKLAVVFALATMLCVGAYAAATSSVLPKDSTATLSHITQITATSDGSTSRTGSNYDSAEAVTAFIRVQKGETIAITFTGVGIEDGDKAFFTSKTDCHDGALTGLPEATIASNIGTYTFTTAGEGLMLCYSFQGAVTKAKGGDGVALAYPYNYYGTLFRISVVDITDITDSAAGWRLAFSNAAIKPTLTVTGTAIRIGDIVSYGSVATTTTCAAAALGATRDGTVGLQLVSTGLKLTSATVATATVTWQSGGTTYRNCWNRINPRSLTLTPPLDTGKTTTYFQYTNDALFTIFPRFIAYDNTLSTATTGWAKTQTFKIRGAAVHKGDTVGFGLASGTVAVTEGVGQAVGTDTAQSCSSILGARGPVVKLAAAVAYPGAYITVSAVTAGVATAAPDSTKGIGLASLTTAIANPATTTNAVTVTTCYAPYGFDTATLANVVLKASSGWAGPTPANAGTNGALSIIFAHTDVTGGATAASSNVITTWMYTDGTAAAAPTAKQVGGMYIPDFSVAGAAITSLIPQKGFSTVAFVYGARAASGLNDGYTIGTSAADCAATTPAGGAYANIDAETQIWTGPAFAGATADATMCWKPASTGGALVGSGGIGITCGAPEDATTDALGPMGSQTGVIVPAYGVLYQKHYIESGASVFSHVAATGTCTTATGTTCTTGLTFTSTTQYRGYKIQCYNGAALRTTAQLISAVTTAAGAGVVTFTTGNNCATNDKFEIFFDNMQWELIPTASTAIADCSSKNGGGKGIFRDVDAASVLQAAGTGATAGLFGDAVTTDLTKRLGGGTLGKSATLYYQYGTDNAPIALASGTAAEYKMCSRANVNHNYQISSTAKVIIHDALFTTFPSQMLQLATTETFDIYIKGGASTDKFQYWVSGNCPAGNDANSALQTIPATVSTTNLGYSSATTLTAKTSAAAIGASPVLCYQNSLETTASTVTQKYSSITTLTAPTIASANFKIDYVTSGTYANSLNLWVGEAYNVVIDDTTAPLNAGDQIYLSGSATCALTSNAITTTASASNAAAISADFTTGPRWKASLTATNTNILNSGITSKLTLCVFFKSVKNTAYGGVGFATAIFLAGKASDPKLTYPTYKTFIEAAETAGFKVTVAGHSSSVTAADKISGFVPNSATTTATKGKDLTCLSYTTGTQGDYTTLLGKTAVISAVGATAAGLTEVTSDATNAIGTGGIFTLCYNLGASTGHYDIGVTSFQVVQIVGFFPNWVVDSTATDVFIAGRGLKDGDSVSHKSAGATCNGATDRTLAANTNTGALALASQKISFPSWAVATTTTTAAMCYFGSTSVTDPSATGGAGFAYTAQKIQIAAKGVGKNSFSAPAAGVWYIYKGNSTTFKFTTAAGTADAVAYNGVKVWAAAKGKTCASTTAADFSAVGTLGGAKLTALTSDAGELSTSASFTTTTPVLTTDDLTLCLSDGVEAAKWYAPSNAVTLHILEVTAVDRAYWIQTGSSANSALQLFIFTGSGLSASDKAWVESGGSSWCTTRAGAANYAVTIPSGTTDGTKTQLAPASGGAEQFTETTTLDTVSLCYQPGGSILAGTGGQMVKAIQIVRLGEIFPAALLAPSSSTDNKRTLQWCGISRNTGTAKVYFTTGTDCKTTTNAAAYASAQAVTLDVQATVADATLLTCVSDTRDAALTTAITTYWTLDATYTAAQLKYKAAATITAPSTDITVADNVVTTITMASGAASTSTTLPTDLMALVGLTGANLGTCAGLNIVSPATTAVDSQLSTATVTAIALTTVVSTATGTSFTGTACSHTFTVKVPTSIYKYPLCWKPTIAKVGGKQEWSALTAATTVKAAGVLSFYPWTILQNNWEMITFSGYWLVADDFASFVATYFSDCSKAWVYEQATVATVTGTPTVAAPNQNTAWFKLPAGTYKLCYYFQGVATGYTAYTYQLAVKGISAVKPTYTSVYAIGVSSTTKFTFTDASVFSGSKLTAKDQVQFMKNGNDCSTTTIDTTLVFNLTATGTTNTEWSPATNPSLTIAQDWQICLSFENAVNYNKLNPVVSAWQKSHVWADSTGVALKITTNNVPKVSSFTPSVLLKNTATDITVWGSMLTSQDKASVLIPTVAGVANTTCDNKTVAENQLPVKVSTTEMNMGSLSATVKATGQYSICYLFGQAYVVPGATQPANPSIPSTVEVVDVASISPTHAVPTAGVVGNTLLSTKITFTGYFGATAPVAPASDMAVFLDKAKNTDCSAAPSRVFSGAASSTLTQDFADVATWKTSTTTEGSYNFTDTDGEFFLCYKFNGMASWVAYPSIVFSSRRIYSIQGRSIEGSVDGSKSSTVTFKGQGIRTYDFAALIFANTTSTNIETECTAAGKVTTTSSNITVDAITGAATASFKLKGVSVGATTYLLCYKFGAEVTSTTAKWETIFKTIDGKSWGLPVLLDVRVISTAADRVQDIRQLDPADVANPMSIKDVSQPTTFYFNGTGLASGKLVRLVVKANATSDKECVIKTQTTGTEGTSEVPLAFAWADLSTTSKDKAGKVINWAARLGYTTTAFNAKFNSGFDLSVFEEFYTATINGGELNANTEYVVCYDGVRTASTFTFKTLVTKEVRGNWPRFAESTTAATTITLFGEGISNTDKAGWTTGTTCDATVATTAISNGQISFTFATKDSNYVLCYNFAGTTTFTLLPSVNVFSGACNQTAPCTAGMFRCGGSCVCQATPCGTRDGPMCPAGTFSCAVGGCYRTQRLCPPVTKTCPAGTSFCADGSCNKLCMPVAECPKGTHVRCADGSCGAVSADTVANPPCIFKGKTIDDTTVPCPSGTVSCSDTGVCVGSGSQCPAYNGCPIATAYQCSDCKCYAKQAECDVSSLKNTSGYICTRDSTNAKKATDCKCFNSEAISTGVYTFKTQTVRRFIVRANAGIDITINAFSYNDGAVAKVSIPASITQANGCMLVYGRIPDSVNMAREGTNEAIVGASVFLGLVDAMGKDCALSSTGSAATVTYSATTLPPAGVDTASLNCLGVLDSSTSAIRASKAATDGTKNRMCELAYSATSSTLKPVALYRGSTPGAVPNGPVTSSTPTPSGSGTTGGTPTPSGGAAAPASSASTVSVSVLTMAVLAIAALIFA